MPDSRQEYWSELPCPPPGDLPNLGIKHRSPALQVDSLPSEPPEKPQSQKNTEANMTVCKNLIIISYLLQLDVFKDIII